MMIYDGICPFTMALALVCRLRQQRRWERFPYQHKREGTQIHLAPEFDLSVTRGITLSESGWNTMITMVQQMDPLTTVTSVILCMVQSTPFQPVQIPFKSF